MTDRNEFLKYAVKDRGMSSQTVRDYISHAYGPENLTRTVIEERQMPSAGSTRLASRRKPPSG